MDLRIMEDPEDIPIVQDPVVRKVLEELQHLPERPAGKRGQREERAKFVEKVSGDVCRQIPECEKKWRR